MTILQQLQQRARGFFDRATEGIRERRQQREMERRQQEEQSLRERQQREQERERQRRPMVFRVGEGLAPEQQIRAEQKVRDVARTAPPAPPITHIAERTQRWGARTSGRARG